MGHDNVAKSEGIMNVVQVIEVVTSDVILHVADDIDALISPHIPTNLPTEVWKSLKDEFKTDLQQTLQQRIQWLVQSANAEAKEVQQQIEQTQIQAEVEHIKIQAQESLRESDVINSRPKTSVSSKVIPDPKPRERKVIPAYKLLPFDNQSSFNPNQSECNVTQAKHAYEPQQLELKTEDFVWPQTSDFGIEETPRRKRRRSGVQQSP